MKQNSTQSKNQNQNPNPNFPQILPNQNNSQFTIHNSAKGTQAQFTILLLLYLTTALAYAALAPLTTGPDELAHYEYVRFIAAHGRLPLNNEERQQASYKSDQPPLYHLLAALPTALVDPGGPPFLKRFDDHPRRQLIERTRHAWGLYNTEDEGWPYRAEVLRWQIGRWVAILFGAATVAVTFFAARTVFEKTGDGRPETGQQLSTDVAKKNSKPWLLALGAATVVAFIPRFGLTGSMLNYETTAAFFAALFLWTLLRLTFNVKRLTLNAIFLGLLAGLAILTKLSALILPLEIIIGLWLIGRFRGWSHRVWLRLSLTALATMAVVISFWFGFVLYQFNTVAQDGLWTGLLRPLIAADASDATTNQLLSLLTGGQAGFTGAIENLETGPPWAWANIFFRTFWLVGIENIQPLVPTALTIALVLCLLAAYGLIMTAVHRPPTAASNPSQDEKDSPTIGDDQNTSYALRPTPHAPRSTLHALFLSLLILHLLVPLILPLLRYAVTFSLADTAQGRHLLFPAAPAFAILLVWGLAYFAFNLQPSTSNVQRLTSNVLRFIFLSPALFLLIWTAAHLRL